MKHAPRLATALTAIVLLAILSVVWIQQPAAATLELSWPCDGPIILPFGDTNLVSPRFHRGIDIAAPEGTEVRSPISGTVRFAGFTPAGGGTVSIDIGGGWRVTLLQLENIAVRAGDQIVAGDVLGRVAASGDASSREPHIHLGLIDPNGTYLDPAAFLPPQASSSGRSSAGESAAVEVASAPVSPAGELVGAGTLVAATDGVGERASDSVSTRIDSCAEPSATTEERMVVEGVMANEGSWYEECRRAVFPDREGALSSQYTEAPGTEHAILSASDVEISDALSIPNLHTAEDRTLEQSANHSHANSLLSDCSLAQTGIDHQASPVREPGNNEQEPLAQTGVEAHPAQAFRDRQAQVSSNSSVKKIVSSGSEQDAMGAPATRSSVAEPASVTLATKACEACGMSVEPLQVSDLSPSSLDAYARDESCGRKTRRSSQAPFASDRDWESALCGVGLLAALAARSRRKGVTGPILQRFVVAAEPA